MTRGKAKDKDDICELLEPFLKLSYSLHKACEFIGQPYRTIKQWYDDDIQFRRKVLEWQNEASNAARKTLINSINSGDEDNGKWWLERKQRNDFSTRTEQKQEHEGGITINLEAIKPKKKKEKE